MITVSVLAVMSVLGRVCGHALVSLLPDAMLVNIKFLSQGLSSLHFHCLCPSSDLNSKIEIF